MKDAIRWWDMDLGYGVLEVHEALTPPGLALELHVVVGSDEHGTLAWWGPRTGRGSGAWRSGMLSCLRVRVGGSNLVGWFAQTTATYDRRGEREYVKAAGMLHMPFEPLGLTKARLSGQNGETRLPLKAPWLKSSFEQR